MKLRKHQAEVKTVIAGIIKKDPRYVNIRDMILAVVAGGGKGSVPVNAGKLILAGLANKICCIVPRQSLQQQAEEVFMDPFFKKLFGVNLQIRSSTNEWNPCRGINGFVTTYQALGHDKQKYVLKEIKSQKYIVILDEFHHVGKDTPWHEAVEEIIKAGCFVIKMSGTLSRADGNRIACIDYKGGFVDLSGNKKTYVIKYTRSDALEEKAILPMEFHLHDGEFSWKKHGSEKIVSVDSFDEVRPDDRSSALYTALQTKFSEQLIDKALHHWLSLKEKNPSGKILFVTALKTDADRTINYLKSLKIPTIIATSHDPKQCEININKFKKSFPSLVTIAVAYEGLDVPEVSHVCLLTRIRSKEWLEQCFSRAVRINKKAGSYYDQRAYIFAPKDALLVEVVRRIRKDQGTIARLPTQKAEQLDLFEVDELMNGETSTGPCIPLKSQILELSKKFIGNTSYVPDVKTMTPKNKELELRQVIDRYVKNYIRETGQEFWFVNNKIKELVNGKSRDRCSLKELEYLNRKIREVFCINSNNQVGYEDIQFDF